MCTVTFIPQNKGFILTSNRDETRTRNARHLVTESLNKKIEAFYPRDTQHGGTWLATSEVGHVVCMLNGAFVPYDRSVLYPASRGALPLYLLEERSLDKLFHEFPMHRVAPYTMVYFDGEQLQEIRYDGDEIHHTLMNKNASQIWSSVTLYPEDVRMRRVEYFNQFLKRHELPSADALMRFHSSQPFGDNTNDFIMNRQGKVETVSITQVVVDDTNVTMRHQNLIEDETIEINRNLVVI
jgi:hypothetical protein